jgi:hypothetical protein
MKGILRQFRSLSASLAAATVAMTLAPLNAEAANPELLAKMAGPWTAVLSGNTGCGASSMYVTFRLNSRGNGGTSATIVGHSTGCPDQTATDQTFRITSIDARGRGTAGLSCGPGCGWVFRIQVAEDGQTFILTDVEPTNPLNTPTGTAIHAID